MNVPKLRFKGFQGDWEEQALEKICLKIKDGTHFSPITSKQGAYKYLTSKNVKNGYLDFSSLEFVSKEAHEQIYKSCDVKFGDVLLTKDGTIGQACVNNLTEEFSLLSSVAFIRLDLNRYNNYFLYQLLVSDIGQKKISQSIAGQALKRITLSKINEFKFCFPSFNEQTKIASFLSVVDDKIACLVKEHELWQQYKQGMMQQLFSQTLRFQDDYGQDFPEWEEKKLGQLYEIGSSKRVLQQDWKLSGIPFLRTREIICLIEHRKFESPIFISDELYKELILKYGKPKKDDLLVSGVGTVGKTYIVKENDTFYFKDGNVIWFKFQNKCDSRFIHYFFQSHIMEKYFQENKSVTTVDTFTIEQAKNINLNLPVIEEQTKIAACLSSIDDKINSVAQQLEQARVWKQGLLQQMFV